MPVYFCLTTPVQENPEKDRLSERMFDFSTGGLGCFNIKALKAHVRMKWRNFEVLEGGS